VIIIRYKHKLIRRSSFSPDHRKELIIPDTASMASEISPAVPSTINGTIAIARIMMIIRQTQGFMLISYGPVGMFSFLFFPFIKSEETPYKDQVDNEFGGFIVHVTTPFGTEL
jgi:hypothetical protein